MSGSESEHAAKRRKLSSPSAENKSKFVASHGNYRGYYSKRGAVNTSLDTRLSLIPREWVQHKRCLDVGCNAGKVTSQLASTYAPYKVTGVDIDDVLVGLAKKQATLGWSLREPLDFLLESRSRDRRHGDSEKINGNDEEEASAETIPQWKTAKSDYFPLSMPRMFGFLPQPPGDQMVQFEEIGEDEAKEATKRSGRQGRGKIMPREVRLFPENLRFRHADWVNKEIDSDRKGYDLILAFSVSKWIHINQLDAGLKLFFTRVFECLRPNGKFILEAQDWNSYTKAKKMTSQLKENYDQLEMRPDDFQRILLEEIGFERVEHLGETGQKGFKRTLQVYHKAGGSYI